MIDPASLFIGALVLSTGVEKYVSSKREKVRRDTVGHQGTVMKVHLVNVEDLLDGLDEPAREALIYSETIGAFIAEGRPLPPEFKTHDRH